MSIVDTEDFATRQEQLKLGLEAAQKADVRTAILAFKSPRLPKDVKYNRGSWSASSGDRMYLVRPVDKNGKQIEEEPIRISGGSGFACYAYRQDSIFRNLAKVKSDYCNFRARAFGNDIYGEVHLGQVPGKGKEEELERFAKYLAIMFYLPMRVLDPDPKSREHYRTMKYGKNLRKSLDDRIFPYPGFMLAAPPLTWFVAGLLRQCFANFENKKIIYGSTYPYKPMTTSGAEWQFSQDIVNAVGDIRELIDKGTYRQILQAWAKVKPYLMNLADAGVSYSDVWFNPYACWRSKSVPYETKVVGPFYTAFSSIHEFERLVLAGGWIALCSPKGWRDQWSFEKTWIPHGETAVCWEKFLRYRTDNLALSLADRTFMKWIDNVPRPKRLLVLSPNHKKIQEKFLAKLKSVPWMKTS